MTKRSVLLPRLGLRRSMILLALALPGPLAALDLDTVARVGDPAPGFAGGTTITSFVEPPSINDAGFVALHVTVSPSNTHAIYRWHRSQSLQLVARGTDQLAFATGTKTLTFLETPIVDDLGWVAFTATLDDGARGMVVWRPTGTLYPVAEVGQTVSIQCEKTDFTPCTVNPVLGPLQTMATFNDRKAAIFRRHFDVEEMHELFFAGVVTTSGSPQGLFRWAIEDDGGSESFASVASTFMHFPGGSSTSYFNVFSNLAACGSFRYALVGVGSNPPLGVIDIDWTGGNAHIAQDRHYTVDLVQRTDLHCVPGDYSFAGARSDVPNDHTQSLRGVFVGTDQVYQYGQAAPVPDALSTLAQPFGQAMTRDAPPRSVFATRISGGGYNGKDGVWLGTVAGAVFDLMVETHSLPAPAELVNQIWAVHVGGSGTVAYHLATSVSGQSIVRNSTRLGNPKRVLTAGDVIPDGAGGFATIDSFWTLGGGFGDPVVTGTGADGLISALNDSGQFALVVFTTPAGSLQLGTATAGVYVAELGLFADDFESSDVCAWSAANPSATC
jgi:hypothetical protein